MVPFKPAEIRIISVLALLALAGSALEIIQRHNQVQRLDLSVFSAKSQYSYRYQSTSLSNSNTAATQIDKFSAIPEALSPDSKIDINQCGYFDLEKLPGIGPALAENIIAFRDSIGGFRNLDDLDRVKGIGPAKLAMLKERIIIK